MSYVDSSKFDINVTIIDKNIQITTLDVISK
jgi:hypothetical protein